MEVFAIAPDGTVAHKWQRIAGGTWTPWVPIDGHLHPLAKSAVEVRILDAG